MEVVSVNGRRVIVSRTWTWKRCFGLCAAWKRCDDPDSDGGAGVAGDGTHRHALRLSQPCFTRAGDLEEGSADRSRTFFHSSSYTANPIACAAALANIEVWRSEPVMERIASLMRAGSISDLVGREGGHKPCA